VVKTLTVVKGATVRCSIMNARIYRKNIQRIAEKNNITLEAARLLERIKEQEYNVKLQKWYKLSNRIKRAWQILLGKSEESVFFNKPRRYEL
jgi:hypothetical protein